MFEDSSLADLRMMFDNTLVRYEEEPVFIYNIDERFKAECLFIGNQEYKNINIRDEKFNFTPVPLGYVNVRGQAIYTKRLPLRKFKQGLSVDCLSIVVHGDDFFSMERFEDTQKQIKSLKSKCLYNTVKRIYPSLENVIASFEDNVRMAAFDRQFAVRSDGLIRYRGIHVGKANLDNAKITFSKGKEYLHYALGNKYENA